MSIDRIFKRELQRIERLPERALYRQMTGMTSGLERKIFSPKKLKPTVKVKQIAREVLWFFGSLLISVLLGFFLFYLTGELLPSLFVQMVSDIGSITWFYYCICIGCFLGIYLIRAVVWAFKTITL
jgi:hypothetical protein